ncbi:MAG: response regulator [Bacteroidales bacterium]|nr:response regulator [Bacteroidales bacterium]
MKSNPLIFVVDDDRTFTRSVEAYLKINNYKNIQCYYTGEDCLKNFHLNPDIIILNYNLAGSNSNSLDGLQILGKINNMFQNPTVIMVSGEMHLYAEKIVEAKFEKGMYRYIMKGDDTLKEIINTINEIVGNA